MLTRTYVQNFFNVKSFNLCGLVSNRLFATYLNALEFSLHLQIYMRAKWGNVFHLSTVQFVAYITTPVQFRHMSLSEPPSLNNENFDRKSLEKFNQFLGSNYKMQVNYGTTFVVFIHWTYLCRNLLCLPCLNYNWPY